MNFVRKKDRAILFVTPDDLSRWSESAFEDMQPVTGLVEVRVSGAEDLPMAGIAHLVHLARQIQGAGHGIHLTGPGPMVDNLTACGLDTAFEAVQAG